MNSYWRTTLPEGQRLVSELRRGSRFRFASSPKRAGRVIDKSECGTLVEAERFVERSFTTKDGKQVTIRKAKERITISNETPVLAYRKNGRTKEAAR